MHPTYTKPRLVVLSATVSCSCLVQREIGRQDAQLLDNTLGPNLLKMGRAFIMSKFLRKLNYLQFVVFPPAGQLARWSKSHPCLENVIFQNKITFSFLKIPKNVSKLSYMYFHSLLPAEFWIYLNVYEYRHVCRESEYCSQRGQSASEYPRQQQYPSQQ